METQAVAPGGRRCRDPRLPRRGAAAGANFRPMTPKDSKTLVIMPTYNERENLPPMAQALLKLPLPVDLLVVDDSSPDGTGQLADELAARHPSIKVLHRADKNGLGRAYCAGFAWALERD